MEIFLTIIFGAIAWVIYHQIFDVVYSDLGKGCLKEIMFSLALGGILAELVMRWWFIAIPVVAFAIYGFVKK